MGGVRQRLSVPYFSSAEALRSFVREVFADDSIKQEEGDFGTRLVVHGAVAATLPPPGATARCVPLRLCAACVRLCAACGKGPPQRGVVEHLCRAMPCRAAEWSVFGRHCCGLVTNAAQLLAAGLLRFGISLWGVKENPSRGFG